MLISTQTEVLSTRLSYADTLKTLKEAGFPAYDMSLFFKPETDLFHGDDWREDAKRLRRFADGLGIVCNQAHAPFPTSRGTEPYDSDMYAAIVKSIEIAAILGAKAIVVHPMRHVEYAEHAEEVFSMNVEFFKSLMPYCEEFGIKVATENCYSKNRASGALTDGACSRAWEFNKYIDAVGSRWMTGCLDIGHASLVNADIPEFIRTAGPDRLQCLHIHDTDFIHDLHTLPFLSKIDFAPAMEALGEIGYRGDITLEADRFLLSMPTPLWPDACRMMCAVASYLKSLVEG